MQRYLAPMGAPECALGDAESPELQPLATRYLTTVLQQAKGSSLGVRSERELRTMSEALDCLTKGEVARCGDILMQRFRAVEAAAVGPGGWNVARHMELIPTQTVSSSTTQASRMALREELEDLKFQEKLAARGSR